MTKSLKTLFISCLLFLVACSGTTNCDQLPIRYSSYEEAVRTIETANFKVKESVNTSKSSWIRGAAYYSCHGTTGFLILKTDNHEYLHSEVPSGVWQGFKNAESFGSYYNQNIKHKYQFKLNH